MTAPSERRAFLLVLAVSYTIAYHFRVHVELLNFLACVACLVSIDTIVRSYLPKPANGAQLPRLLIVEGVISSGKTTFINSAKQYIEKRYAGTRVEIVDEAIVPSFLAAYIGDMVNKGRVYAFAFQAYMAITRRYQWFNTLDKLALYANTIFIFDRSRIGDTAFADKQHRQGYMSDEQMKIYADILWKPTGDSVESAYLRSDCLFIYLQCSPGRALERNRVRNNRVEVDGYERADFELLEECYAKAMARVPRGKLLPLDWNENKPLDERGCLLDNVMESVFSLVLTKISLQ